MSQELAQEISAPTGSWVPCWRLSIVVGHGELFHLHALYAEIVHRAHRFGLAGASALVGIEGCGVSGTVHGPTRLMRSPGRGTPIAVVILDSQARIEAFLPQLADIADRAVVTVNPARLHRCATGPRASWWQQVSDWWVLRHRGDRHSRPQPSEA